ncbi:MAG: murein transglycosylase domain-containing protein [Candidatus Cryptobacteroides sp.]
MKRLATFILPMLVPVILSGQVTRDSLDNIVRQAQENMAGVSVERNQEFAEALEQYLEYERQLRAEYEEYKEKVMAQWGDESMVESSRKVWVEYGNDDSTRTIVDFENGTVTVEVLGEASDDDALLNERLVSAIGHLMTSCGRTIGFDSKVAKDEPITEYPIMAGQLDLSEYQSVVSDYQTSGTSLPKVNPALSKGGQLSISRGAGGTVQEGTMAQKMEQKRQEQLRLEQERQEQLRREQEAKAASGEAAVAESIVEKQKPQAEVVGTSTGDKKILKIELQLVEDHIPKRAEQFKELVNANSRKFTVDEPLIFAIMEQESAFNPAAKSHVPAYGLMQLVPRSGGRDAYRYVFKVDKVPTADYLFNPGNNIELGTAYLRLLMTTSFANVTDSRCRMLCAIAAYNTGAGNVSRAFTGDTNISKAIPKINSMTYDQLFSHLKKYLPHGETRDYIQKVTGKMQKYIKN